MIVHVAEERPVGMRTGYRAPEVETRWAADDIHPLRARGPNYPPHNSDAPIFDGIDMAGPAAAIVGMGA